MAVTKIKTIKRTVGKNLAYIMNEEKTQGKLLVSGFGVTPETADIEFKMTENLAEKVNGDRSKIGGGNNLAYHMIQSFSPEDNLTPEQAHEIGKQWADEILQGNHEYVIATHIDKGQLHNHVIFNATSFETMKKFRTEPYKTKARISEISDKLCEEHGLHVIDNPIGRGMKAYEYQQNKKGKSWKAKIEKAVDNAIPRVANFAELEERLQGLGINIITDKKYLTFEIEGSKNRVRANGKGLSFDYSREGIENRIKADKSKNLQLVTLNKKLVEEGKTTYFTRIPGEKNSYVRFEKDASFWHKNNITLNVFLDESKSYDICNRYGIVTHSIKGQELLKNYTLKNKQPLHDKQLVTEPAKLRGKYTEINNTVVPLDRTALYFARKQRIENINEIANALAVMGQEGIIKYSDFEQKTKGINAHVHRIKNEKLKPLEKQLKLVQEATEHIVTYNKYKPLIEEIGGVTGRKKDKMLDRYSMEVKTFDYTTEKLNSAGIPTDTPAETMLSALDKIKGSREIVRGDIKALESRKKAIENAKRIYDEKIVGKAQTERNITRQKDIAL